MNFVFVYAQVEPEDVELVIEVRDVNDEKPVFVPSYLVGEMKEDTTNGKKFCIGR